MKIIHSLGSSHAVHPRMAVTAMYDLAYNKRMQPDFGELALASAADARRYKALVSRVERNKIGRIE